MRVDLVVLCKRLPPAPPEGFQREFCGLAVDVVQGPAIEALLPRPLPFKAPKALVLSGTLGTDWDLVIECLEPLVDAVAGELWTEDGRVLYRGRGRRMSFGELVAVWKDIAHGHELKRELAHKQSHARFKAIEVADPHGVEAANDWSGVLPEGMDDLDASG